MLHQVNHFPKTLLVLFDLLQFLLGTQEDKSRVELSCSAFHLNECFYRGKLIKANNQVASTHIEAFLHHIGSD
jgi:hypothetical protein